MATDSPRTKLFYMQDARQCVGNDVLWWRRGKAGYTTDLRDAHIFTEEEARNPCRPTDRAWPKAYVDALTKPTVDIQDLRDSLREAVTDGE